MRLKKARTFRYSIIFALLTSVTTCEPNAVLAGGFSNPAGPHFNSYRCVAPAGVTYKALTPNFCVPTGSTYTTIALPLGICIGNILGAYTNTTSITVGMMVTGGAPNDAAEITLYSDAGCITPWLGGYTPYLDQHAAEATTFRAKLSSIIIKPPNGLWARCNQSAGFGNPTCEMRILGFTVGP